MQEIPRFRLAYLIGSTGWGGLEMNQINNATWMQERGHYTVIYCIEKSPSHQYLMTGNVPYVAIKKHKNHFDLFKAFTLWKELKHKGIQHLIIRSVFDMSIAASVCFFSGKNIKVHYFMEMQLSNNKKQWFRTLRYRYFSSWNCPLDYLKNQVLDSTKMKKEKVHVIPSAVRNVFFEQRDKKSIRNELGLPDDKLILGLFGRIDRKKNQLLALQALHLLSEPNIILLVVGQETPDDPQQYLAELKKYTKEKNLEKQVIFTGYFANTSEYVHAVDACIITSLDESIGLTTLEAIAAGKITLGANTGGTKELLDKHNGFLFNSDNIQELVNLLYKLKQDELHWVPSPQLLEENKFNSVCERVEELLLSCS